MNEIENHPAVLLGRWLKNARQAKRIVKRVFAGQIDLTSSKYSEVEAGVIHWLRDSHRQAIATTLDLGTAEFEIFNTLLLNARKAVALSFSNVFTREQLEPMRYRHNDKTHQPSEVDKEAILNAVFAEIA